MQSHGITRQRPLRVCYLDSEKRLFSARKADMEHLLQALAEVTLVPLKSLDDPSFHPCDLLVVTADHIPVDHFGTWLETMKGRLRAQNGIKSPCLILADLPFKALNQMLAFAMKENWYFDIIHPDHSSSLPIRVANLLRIHDHIHELGRYEQELMSLQDTLGEVEEKLRRALANAKRPGA